MNTATNYKHVDRQLRISISEVSLYKIQESALLNLI